MWAQAVCREGGHECPAGTCHVAASGSEWPAAPPVDARGPDQLEGGHVIRMNGHGVPGPCGHHARQVGRHEQSATSGSARLHGVRSREGGSPRLGVDGVVAARDGRGREPSSSLALLVVYEGVGDFWKLLKVRCELDTAFRAVEDRHVGRFTPPSPSATTAFLPAPEAASPSTACGGVDDGAVTNVRNDHVKIHFRMDIDEDGWPPASVESLWAVDLGDGTVRLDNTPWFVRGVASDDQGRPVCERCWGRPLRTCTDCGALAPTKANGPCGPLCQACYRRTRQPRRICSGCGELTRISRRASSQADDTGKICYRCYRRPTTDASCAISGRQRPCYRRRDGTLTYGSWQRTGPWASLPTLLPAHPQPPRTLCALRHPAASHRHHPPP